MDKFTIELFDSREEWLSARRQGIGASQSAALFDQSPWLTKFTLWSELVGVLKPSNNDSERLKWGLLLEPTIAGEYAERTGRKLDHVGQYTICRSAFHPFLCATLDRVIRDDVRGNGVLEIKTTSERFAHEWDDEPPLHYQIQLQHQLAVTGYAWGSLCCLIGGQELRWIDFERNDEFILLLIEKCDEFWKRVKTETPPPVDDSKKTREALAKLYPKESGETISLDDDSLVLDNDYSAVQQELKRLETRKRGIENQLIERIGNASKAILPNGISYTYKEIERKGYTVEPSRFRQLRRRDNGVLARGISKEGQDGSTELTRENS